MNGILLRLLIFVLFLGMHSAHAAVVLQYHHVDNDTPKSTSISPELFAQHLDYLEAEKFNVVSLETLLTSLRNKQALPPKSVVITFDDGYRSILDNALPLLKKKQFPFTVFVNTLPIKQKLKQFMNWQELQTLIDNGATIANHSVGHVHFIRRLEGESSIDWQKRITSEILDSQKVIDENLSKSVRALAYPYGEFSFEVKKLVKKIGFYAFGQQSGAVPLNVDLQAIPRFPFGGNYGEMQDFKIKVNSLPLPLESIELLDREDEPLADHVLSSSHKRPKIRLKLSNPDINLTCYFSFYGAMEKQVEKGKQVYSPKGDLRPGRSRYNCTAPSGKAGQFYWFSQPWIKPNADGSWYTE